MPRLGPHFVKAGVLGSAWIRDGGGGGFVDPTSLDGLTFFFKSNTDVYQEDTFTTPSQNLQVVGGWKDQSGNDNHATQATASLKPLRVQLGANWFIECDQTDDYLALALTGSAVGTWMYGSSYGTCLTPQLNVGTNPRLPGLSNLMIALAYDNVKTGDDRANLVSWASDYGCGDEVFWLLTTDQTNISHTFSGGDAHTITFKDHDGNTYSTSANETTDVAAQGLSAPITILVPLSVKTDTALTKIDMQYEYIYGCIPDLSGLTALTWVYLDYNHLSGSIPDLSANTSLAYFKVYGNQLTGYAGTSMPSSLINFDARDNLLPQSAVDDILVQLDEAGATYGYCRLAGGNAAPSSTGLTAKSNLEGKNWTVTVSS